MAGVTEVDLLNFALLTFPMLFRRIGITPLEARLKEIR